MWIQQLHETERSQVLCWGYCSQRSCTSDYEYQTASQSERSKQIYGQWWDRLLLQARSMRADDLRHSYIQCFMFNFYSHAVSGWVTVFFGMFKIWKWICSNLKGYHSCLALPSILLYRLWKLLMEQVQDITHKWLWKIGYIYRQH